MRHYKFSGLRLYVITAIILGLIMVCGYQAGQASPAKERIKVDARELILGDAGDSVAGGRLSKAANPKGAAGKTNPAADQSFLNGVFSFFGKGEKTISLAYTCVAEKLLYDRIIPEFQKYWLDKTGEQVKFATGYALPDFDKLSTSVSGQPVQVLLMSSSTNSTSRGFAKTKWQDQANKGVVLSLPQVYLVRKGNPKRIMSYADLTLPGIRVLHINPLTGTGGGLWQVYGFYGSALKESELTTGHKDQQLALERLQKIEDNAFYEVTQVPEVMKLFLEGVGDVLVMSEPSALKAIKNNDTIELVVPPYTMINDLAIYQMKENISYGDREVIDEFVDFLFAKESQTAIAEYGFRPSDPVVLASHPEFSKLDNSFDINYLGEQTELKRNLILGKWLTINNQRSSKTYDDLASR